MKKKLLVLLIAAASTLMPNFASAIAIDIEGEEGCDSCCYKGTTCCLGPGTDGNFMPCSWCD